MGNSNSIFPSNGLSRQEGNPLVAGYIRSSVDFEVPLALVQLCLNYYDEVVMRKVSVQKLDKHFRTCVLDMEKLNRGPGRAALFPLIKVQYNMGLWFLCFLMRKEEGDLSETRLIIMHLCSEDIGVRCLAYQTRLRINETGTDFMRICHHHGARSDPSNICSGPLIELQDLAELESDSLCFSFEVTIDWVSYSNGKIERFIDNPVQLRKSWRFNTEINGQEICSVLEKEKFIFPVQGSNAANWRIVINNQLREVDMEYDYMKIQPIRMPYDVTQILYQFEVRFSTKNGAEITLEAGEWLTRDENFCLSLWDSTLRLDEFQDCFRAELVTISVEALVLEVITRDDHRIDSFDDTVYISDAFITQESVSSE